MDAQTWNKDQAAAWRRHRERLELDYPALADFDQATLEWRRLFAELFGTFLLVVAGAARPRRRSRRASGSPRETRRYRPDGGLTVRRGSIPPCPLGLDVRARR
jgi:hypothetical protein